MNKEQLEQLKQQAREGQAIVIPSSISDKDLDALHDEFKKSRKLVPSPAVEFVAPIEYIVYYPLGTTKNQNGEDVDNATFATNIINDLHSVGDIAIPRLPGWEIWQTDKDGRYQRISPDSAIENAKQQILKRGQAAFDKEYSNHPDDLPEGAEYCGAVRRCGSCGGSKKNKYGHPCPTCDGTGIEPC